MNANKENIALAVQNQGFAVLENIDNSVMSAELDGLDLQFDRIKIPSGGGVVFEVPGDGEELDTVRDFTAVILHHHPLNVRYQEQYNGSNIIPDCSSFDGVNGIGNPGGNCKTCPHNQFGSSGTSAKSCKNRRRIYILMPNTIFPMLLSLPTGSLKTFTKYLQSQLSKGRSSSGIVTKFSLKKAVNAGGIAYSQCVFSFDRVLTSEEQKAIQAMTEQVKSFAVNVGFDTENSAECLNVNPATGEIITDGDVPF